MEIVLGPFSFSSKFECGNLAKVLPILLTGSTTIKSTKNLTPGCLTDAPIDYEFNLWTKPDCGGTEFENNNRTWFFFSIKGGISSERVQLSVMNLNKQSKLYSQGMQPVVRCVGDYVQSSNWERIKEKCSYRSEDNSTVVSWVHTVPPENSITYYAFTYPYTFSQLQTFLQDLDGEFLLGSSDLYYYRELLNYSLDGSRIDLLTITSPEGKQEEREDRLDGIFPDLDHHRAHRFVNKKVVFVSARVHPGETPSSFVMSGFIHFILSSDLRAKRLRERFVFKIIPMLNPDGVNRGHYRTDQRGVNLNRVYCNPSPDLHPTIYAAKKVILYYHYGMNAETLAVKEGQTLGTSSPDGRSDSLKKNVPPLLDEDTCHSFSDAVIKSAEPSTEIPRPSTKPYPILDADEPSASGWDCSSNVSADSSFRVGSLHQNWDDCHEESSQKYFAGSETGVTSMFDSMSTLRDFKILSDQRFKTPPKTTSFPGDLPLNSSHPTLFISDTKQQSDLEDPKSVGNLEKSSYMFPSDQKKSGTPLSSLVTESITSGKNVGAALSSSFAWGSSCSINDSTSTLFMYMDFHGHASKRGIFMYGNWFEDPVLMVENMLYPKLLSLHCSNFDFGACNFSERNMYHRDRRDGMSKEGSGRVSVMRSTGLIRSYTLECNYNTGRLVSPIPPTHGSQRPLSFHGLPPKYTPATFEDCGHKLAICLHDLVEADDGSTSIPSGVINLSAVRNELFNLLSSSSASPRNSNLSSCSLQGSTPSPKTTTVKSLKDFKCASEDTKCKHRGSISKTKNTSVTNPKVMNLPVAAYSSKQPSALHSYGSGRRQSLSSSVDAENQEPILQRPRLPKAKNMKGKIDIDISQVKTKKFRHKAISSKSSSQSLLYKDRGETSHFSANEKLGSSKHSLSGAVCLPGDGTFKMSGSEKPHSPKLVKKIEKGRKQRAKTLKFGSKKLKSLSSFEAASSFKPDQFGQMALQKEEDTIGSTIAIDSCCVSNPNPLSPRSPLASVFETQTTQGSQGGTITLNQQSPTFVSSSKNSFHSCAKRQSKSLKSVAPSGDRYPISSPTSGQRLKLFSKKLKKKASNVSDVSTKYLSKPTTSQTPLQWVIRKPLKITTELEASNPLNPRIKKRKKSGRKSI